MLLPIGAVYFAVYYFTFRFCIERFDLKTPGRDAAMPIEKAAAIGSDRAEAFVAALGGGTNLVSIDACTTRLRLVLADTDVIDEGALRTLGARGFIKPGDGALQVVLGPIADTVASEIRSAARQSGVDVALDPSIVSALGGEANIAGRKRVGDRVRIVVLDQMRIDADSLDAAVRGRVLIGHNILHILL